MGTLKAKLVRAWCWLVGHDLMPWSGEDRDGYQYWEHECLRCGKGWGGPW